MVKLIRSCTFYQKILFYPANNNYTSLVHDAWLANMTRCLRALADLQDPLTHRPPHSPHVQCLCTLCSKDDLQFWNADWRFRLEYNLHGGSAHMDLLRNLSIRSFFFKFIARFDCYSTYMHMGISKITGTHADNLPRHETIMQDLYKMWRVLRSALWSTDDFNCRLQYCQLHVHVWWLHHSLLGKCCLKYICILMLMILF